MNMLAQDREFQDNFVPNTNKEYHFRILFPQADEPSQQFSIRLILSLMKCDPSFVQVRILFMGNEDDGVVLHPLKFDLRLD